MERVSVDRIDTFERFKALEANWGHLYREDDEAEYFLSWSWLSQLYASSDEQILILAVKTPDAHSGYCAFLPLRQTARFSQSRNRYFNTYSMAGNYWADSTGLICDREWENVAIPVLAQALKSFAWQAVSFNGLKVSPHRKALFMSAFHNQLYSAIETTPSVGDENPDVSVSPVVLLPDTFEQYLQNVASTDISHDMIKLIKATENDKSLSVVLADNNSIDQYLEFFENSQIESAFAVENPISVDVITRYTRLISEGVRSDQMLVLVLINEAKPVGLFALYKDHVKMNLHFFVASYNESFAVFSGGLLLHTYSIKWAIENQYSSYHLARGNERHKYLLGAINAKRYDIVVYKRKPSPESQLLSQNTKGGVLALLREQRCSRSIASVHKLYGQLLESFPNDLSVLSHYADWLDSVKLMEHAGDIQRYIAGVPEHAELNTFSELCKKNTPIVLEDYLALQRWLLNLELYRQALDVQSTMNIRGLQIQFASSEPDYSNWLNTYLQPVISNSCRNDAGAGVNAGTCSGNPEESKKDEEAYRFNCIHSNELSAEFMQMSQSTELEVSSLKLAGRRIERMYLKSDLVIDVSRSEGLIWVSDNAQRQLTLLMSSRTAWPSLEVSRTARALIIAYLQQEGWHFLHSGAVRVDGENYLVIGDEGQGKTSLIVALMSGGCEYISNERVFARYIEGKVEVLSFPMPVAIGIGTAMQYPAIMEYIYNPESCLYPNRRMNANKLRSRPQTDWPSFSDKLQLLMPELTAAFGHESAVQGGQISGVIVPAIVREGDVHFKDNVTILKKAELRKIVSRNRISAARDTRYPAWLPLAFAPLPTGISGSLIDAICELPSVQFEYFANSERQERVNGYPLILQNALQSAKPDEF